MSTPARQQPRSPINILLMLQEHLPHRHREALEEIASHEKRIAELRAEVSRMEKHGAIEGILLNHVTGEDAPSLVEDTP